MSDEAIRAITTLVLVGVLSFMWWNMDRRIRREKKEDMRRIQLEYQEAGRVHRARWREEDRVSCEQLYGSGEIEVHRCIAKARARHSWIYEEDGL